MSDKKESQIELSSQPFDSISSVKFSPTNSSRLLVASWDATVRYYDIDTNEQKCKFDHRAAVLDCCFSPDGKYAYTGGLDTYVRELDLESESIRHLGQHSAPVSRLVYSKATNQLITGSWDRTLKFWDPRQPEPPFQRDSFELPERVYQMDITGTTLVVGLASRIFQIFDVRKMDKPAQQRESSLKFMTRALACMADGQGYATGSVEGRISVEYFDPDPKVQEKKYAFKCHRQPDPVDKNIDNVWPVNALAFHPVYNTFASAGSDGTVLTWDHKSKKRLRAYPKYPNAIPSIAFSHDGTRLAVGVSYNWDNGPEGQKNFGEAAPKIFVREIGDEIKPKGWTG